MPYKFYSDSGHGWLAVKRQELIDLNLINRISHYSYQRGKTVYLEEDCDASLFFQAKGLLSYEMSKEHFIEKHSDRSPIRSYDSFKPI